MTSLDRLSVANHTIFARIASQYGDVYFRSLAATSSRAPPRSVWWWTVPRHRLAHLHGEISCHTALAQRPRNRHHHIWWRRVL